MRSKEKIEAEKARLFKEMMGLPKTSIFLEECKRLRAMISALNWVLNLGD